jgi:type I restriction enzyme S subunit
MNFSDAEEAVFRLEPDDILVVEASGSAGEVGKSAIYRGEIASACFQNTLLRVRCTKAVPAFVQKYLLAEALAGRLVKESRGVGIHHIGQARLAALPVAVPSEEDQVRIGEAASDLMHAAAGCRESIRTARRRADGLRKGLLNAAFSGRQADGLRPSGVEEVLHV